MKEQFPIQPTGTKLIGRFNKIEHLKEEKKLLVLQNIGHLKYRKVEVLSMGEQLQEMDLFNVGDILLVKNFTGMKVYGEDWNDKELDEGNEFCIFDQEDIIGVILDKDIDIKDCI